MKYPFPLMEADRSPLKCTNIRSWTNDFKVTTDKGKTVEYTPGVYYQGIVKGDNASIVAFSFFNDDIVGVCFYSGIRKYCGRKS